MMATRGGLGPRSMATLGLALAAWLAPSALRAQTRAAPTGDTVSYTILMSGNRAGVERRWRDCRT